MPPIGGRKTCKSGRVTSSGNMPAVCSNSCRRRLFSVVAKRSAIPGRYHTGSIAVMLQPSGGDGRLQFGQIEPRAGDGDRGADVDALGNFSLEILGDQMAPR